MLAKSTCLHIPPLYEEDMARIMWESSEGADGYELDVNFNEDFESASMGKTWADIDDSRLSWFDTDAMGLSWEELARRPAQGLRWRSIEFHNLDWAGIDSRGLSWSDIQRLPVEFTVFKGAGEKTQGPDQGLTWQDVEGHGLSWAEIEALEWSWETFMFRPSVGLTWKQLDGEGVTWAEINARGWTWHDFEFQEIARGLSWGSLDGRFLSWEEIEALDMNWKRFEIQPADSKTHIAHTVDIPVYKKKAVFRVRAYKDGEYSVYLTSTLIDTLPRSLAKYKPPCLHIPKLYREGKAKIVWSDLYGASGYTLERKMGSEDDFKVIYDGPGEEVPHPADCKGPEELYYTPDCKRHFQFTDQIPIYETTAAYRIKAYNTTDESQYLVSEVITLLPRSLAKYKPPCLHVPKLFREGTAKIVWGELYDASKYVLERQVDGGAFTKVEGQATLVPPPFAGYKWSEWKAQNLTWKQFEGKGMSWFQIESLPTPGLAWGDLDGLWLTWKEIESKGLTWKQFEKQEAHEGNHFALIDDIPLYAKTIAYRIKASNSTDSSQYLVTGTINTLPRSLAKYKPPCLHIPELHEGKIAEIIWGDLYDASGYILERKLGSKAYDSVFEGPGKPVPHPADCDKPKLLAQTPDCKQHLSCDNEIPYGEKTAQYRIKGSNDTDSSQYLESAVMDIIPLFYREDSLRAFVMAGGEYLVQLHAKEIGDFESIWMNLTYDPVDLAVGKVILDAGDGKIDTGINASAINVSTPELFGGKLRFRCVKAMKTGKDWNGLLLTVRFRVLRSGTTTVTLS